MDPGNFHVVLVRNPILCTRKAINNEATPPLAFALIGGYLRKQGYRVTVVDGIGMGISEFWDWEERDGFVCQGARLEKIIDAIPQDADLIAFSCMFSGEWTVSRALIRQTRRRFPKVPFVAGGEHISALPEYSLRDCPELDFIAGGEGEVLLGQICEVLRRGDDPRALTGIKYLDGAVFVDRGAFSRYDKIDEIPWPDWQIASLEPYWQAHKSYGISTGRDMPIMVSRGCPYRCTFCSSPQMWTTKYLLRDVDDVLNEIDYYIKTYGATSLQFYDLTAITKKQWTVEFCTKMIERGIHIKWSLPSGTRSEALDEEVVPLLEKTNCTYLVYAPESGCPETLEKIKKRIKLDRLDVSIRAAKRHGLTLRTNLIIGFPHETRRQIFQTVRYGWKLALMGVDEVSINIFSPYPGSELFAELLEQKRLHIDDNYFYSLTSLNSDYTSFNPLSFCRAVGPRELAFYRILFMLSNYAISYIFFPSRILRTIRNLFRHEMAATVFEHRLQDLLKRKAA